MKTQLSQMKATMDGVGGMEASSMPITYEVRDDGLFVHTKAMGKITEQDLVNYRAAVLSDARVYLGFGELFDGTAADSAGLSQAVIERMMEVDRQHREKLRGGKCAIVIRTRFDLGDKLEKLHNGPHTVMVFFNLDVAQTWLGERAKGALPG